MKFVAKDSSDGDEKLILAISYSIDFFLHDAGYWTLGVFIFYPNKELQIILTHYWWNNSYKDYRTAIMKEILLSCELVHTPVVKSKG